MGIPNGDSSPASEIGGTTSVVATFGDGREVSEWMRIVRSGGHPTIDLLDQLKSAGWKHISICKLEEILTGRHRRQSIGYAKINKVLSKGCELEVEATDTNGNRYQMALCRNEFTLLHGYTTNYRGPELRTLLKVATGKTLSSMLLATR